MDFENIMTRVTDLAQAGAAKAKELAEIAKLKVNSAAEEDAIRKAYIEIGKMYYAERGMAPDAAYAALCEKINASKEKIAYNKQKIADIKAANNISDEEIPEEDFAANDVAAEGFDEEPVEVPSDPENPEE